MIFFIDIGQFVFSSNSHNIYGKDPKYPHRVIIQLIQYSLP